jgi:FkbM family methyltransferase
MQDIVTVEGRHGRFLVNPHDVYIGQNLIHYGEYGEIEWQFISRFIKTGNVVLDIGANVGGFAVPMANTVGSKGVVLAFEPQPAVFHLLSENARHNNLTQLLPFRMGLGAAKAQLETNLPDYGAQGNYGAVSFTKQGAGLKVDIERLDDVFQQSQLSFMKIDIEGMELDALQGAQKTARRFRPIIYVENDRPEKSPALIEWFFQNQYRLWWHTTPLFNPHNFRNDRNNIYGPDRILCINMIAVPIERIDLLPLIPHGLRPITDVNDTLVTATGIMDSEAA